MTKAEFTAQHLDELIGLLMAAFDVEARAATGNGLGDNARRGAFMLSTFERARQILSRMHDALKAPKEPRPLSVDEIAEWYMARYVTLTPTEATELNAKLKAKLKPQEAKK